MHVVKYVVEFWLLFAVMEAVRTSFERKFGKMGKIKNQPGNLFWGLPWHQGPRLMRHEGREARLEPWLAQKCKGKTLQIYTFHEFSL